MKRVVLSGLKPLSFNEEALCNLGGTAEIIRPLTFVEGFFS